MPATIAPGLPLYLPDTGFSYRTKYPYLTLYPGKKLRYSFI